CHTQLAERRPHPVKLTEFYLLISIGGVLGGAFNAFVAPLIFDNVWEFPLVLVLACLARPWGKGGFNRLELSGAAVVVVVCLFVFLAYQFVNAEWMPAWLRDLTASAGKPMRFPMIAA